jgi:hypothetical protein
MKLRKDVMNIFPQKFCWKFFSVLSCAVFLCELAASGQSISVTPSAVSSTYSGVITLNITGLTNGEEVTIQHFLDLNGNGVVDPGEPLVDAFKITDGGASVIGGVTNLNVPFDSNATTGAITTALSFAPPLENIVGHHIYRLVSPTKRFSAQNINFLVTNAPLAQFITGTVFMGGTPVPAALVQASVMPDDIYVGAVVADSNGHYLLNLNSGTYSLAAGANNTYFDAALAPPLTLPGAMSVTNNMFLTNGTATISGRVYDSGNSNTLGGVSLELDLKSGNLVAFAFSDTNGNYAAGVTSNKWGIRLNSERMARRAYVVSQVTALSVDTTHGSVTNANLALTKGSALFYGRVADGSNNPLANVDIGYTISIQYKASGYSDTKGEYTVAVWGGTNVWSSYPVNDNFPLYSNYVFSQSVGTNLNVNQALSQNFTGLLATATISGRVLNNLGNPIAGVSVAGDATINGTDFTTFSYDTDTNGAFTLAVPNGTWIVTGLSAGNKALGALGYYEPDIASVSVPPSVGGVTLIAYPTNVFFLSQPQRISSTQFGMELNAAAGYNYTILTTTNISLPSTNWNTLLIVSNLFGNSYFIQDNQATNRQRFYRTLLGP